MRGGDGSAVDFLPGPVPIRSCNEWLIVIAVDNAITIVTSQDPTSPSREARVSSLEASSRTRYDWFGRYFATYFTKALTVSVPDIFKRWTIMAASAELYLLDQTFPWVSSVLASAAILTIR